MGKSWDRTPEQDKFLQDQVKQLIKARVDETVKDFRHELHERWEALWPEIKVVFPQRTDTDPELTLDQIGDLSKAMASRKKQLYTRVRWLANTKAIRTRNPKSLLARYLRKAEGKKLLRKRSILVIYSDLYYQKKLQPLVNAAMGLEPKSLSQSEQASRSMKHYHRIRAESWSNESPEVRTEVLKIYDNEVGDEDEENEDDETEEDEDERSLLLRQQQCIEIIGSVVNAFLQDANEATGFSFTLLGGGLDQEGNVKMCMSSVGKTAAGKTFMNYHKGWEEGVSKPFKEFLCVKHPHEERLRRASLWEGKSQTPGAQTPNQPELSPPQVPTVPTPNFTAPILQQDSIIQPDSLPAQVSTVPSLNLVVRPDLSPAQMPTVPSPDLGVQPDLSESPAHVTTVPNAQLSLVPQTVNSSLAQNQNQGLFHFPQIPNLGFAPTLNSDFDPNSQGSLMDLMSEAMYTLPNHDKQELDQDLFNFGRFQDLEKNTSNEDTNVSLPSINFSSVAPANSTNLNSNTPENITSLSHVPSFLDALFVPGANFDRSLNHDANILVAGANVDSPPDANTLVPVTNIDTPPDANTPSSVTTQKTGTTSKTSRKRKSDVLDVVLPDGSRRVRKQKGRPDENIPVSTKKGKKKVSGKK